MLKGPDSGTHGWRSLLLEVLLLALGFVLVTAAALAAYAEVGVVGRLVLAALAGAAMSAVYAGAVGWVESRPVSELAWRRAGRVLVGVLVGAGLVTATVLLVAGLGGYRITGTNPLGVLLARVGPSLHSAVWEELLFRGILFRWLWSWWGGTRAVAVSAVVFGGLHGVLENGSLWSAVAVALEAGVLLSLAYWASGDLWLPIGMHFGWNLTLGGVFGSAVSGSSVPGVFVAAITGPAWITGGAFGIEASIPAVAVCLTASTVFWRLTRARS